MTAAKNTYIVRSSHRWDLEPASDLVTVIEKWKAPVMVRISELLRTINVPS